MSRNSSPLNQNLFLWVSANILGFAVLGVLLFLIPLLMSLPGIVPAVLIISIPIGLAQWIALRRILHASALWILTVPAGLFLFVFVNRIMPGGLWPGLDDESILVLTAWYFVVGFSIGLPQWLLLRQHVSHSSIWLIGSSAAVAAGSWLVLATDLINRSGLLASVVAMLTYTVVTGFTLAWLLMYGHPSNSGLTRPA